MCWRARSTRSAGDDAAASSDVAARQPLTQERVTTFPRGDGVVLVCGRFEGVDERVIDARGLEEVSVGDYVLSGGEIAALVLMDACVRLLPGVMGKAASGHEESFARGSARIPAIHPAAGVRGPADPGGPDLRGPRQGRRLAAGRGRKAHPRTAGRDLWAASSGPIKPLQKSRPTEG